MLLLLLTSSFISVALSTPSISFVSPDVVTDIGGEVALTCSISGGSDYPVMWNRLNDKGIGLPLSSGNTFYIKDKRFRLEHEPGSESYTLAISDVRPSDDATYQCRVVVDLHKMVTADVKLQVRVPPEMTDRGSPSTVVGTAGKSVALECVAEAFPAPKIVWTREDGRLLFNGKARTTAHKLILPKLRMEDNGRYVCTASNGVGDSDPSRVVELSVEFAPIVNIPSPRVAQALGYEAALECLISAYPPPAIFWSKDGEKIIGNNDRVAISHFATQDHATMSKLMITSVTETDYGRYTCEASSRFGAANASLVLYQANIPICPPVCGDFDLMQARAKAATFKTGVAFVASVVAMGIVL